jgi:hypothetical protein
MAKRKPKSNKTEIWRAEGKRLAKPQRDLTEAEKYRLDQARDLIQKAKLQSDKKAALREEGMTASSSNVEQASGQTGEEVERADWEDVHVKRNWDDGLVKRHPKSKVAVLARPGMLTNICDSDGTGIIETVTADFAIVRFEDGRVEAFYWGEVCLDCVQPDLGFIARAPEKGALKLGEEASKVALLARRLASVLDELGFMDSEGKLTTANEFGKVVEELEKQYRKLWELAGEELLLSEEVADSPL